MTVVAAIARHGRVVMAADTMTNYANTGVLGARKIARIGTGADAMLLAASGSGALLSVHQHWKVDGFPNPDDPLDVIGWANMCATALTEIAAAQTPPILTDTQGGGQCLDGAFLLGWRGRLIYLFTHQAVVVPNGLAGLGMGTDYALGFMEAVLDHGLDGKPDLEWTVNAAVDGACDRYDGCRIGRDGALVETLEAA